jgi:16S rRNA (uracil1498-N3)-methyltransferase
VIGVGFSLVKGDRNELIVQKLTELGVDRIVPVLAERCVVRWDAGRAERHHARLVKVARAAAMQSRRSRLPEVSPLTPFAVAANVEGACLATQGGGPVGLARPFVLIGPEGGWSPDERSSGLVGVGLAPYVLRSETAAIVAAALLAGLRGRFI